MERFVLCCCSHQRRPSKMLSGQVLLDTCCVKSLRVMRSVLQLQDDEDGREGARGNGSTGRQSLNAQLNMRARRRDWQVTLVLSSCTLACARSWRKLNIPGNETCAVF